MKHPTKIVITIRKTGTTTLKPAILAAAMAAGIFSRADRAEAMIPEPPSTNQITLKWRAPYKGDTNLSYNIYYAPDLAIPVSRWQKLANVPWSNTSLSIAGTAQSGFFVVGVSNFWGESRLIGGAAPAPGKRSITLAWDYQETNDPGLAFNLYHSGDVTAPMDTWQLLTNVPGNARSLTLSLAPGVHAFTLTASNAEGESDFSNRATTPPFPRPVGSVSLQ